MPGKSGEPPAAQLAALSVGVDIALEAFQYVIALSIAGLGREAGGMVQEMTLFAVRPPGRGMMSLLLTSAPLGGEEKVIFMTFSSQMSSVMEELH